MWHVQELQELQYVKIEEHISWNHHQEYSGLFILTFCGVIQTDDCYELPFQWIPFCSQPRWNRWRIPASQHLRFIVRVGWLHFVPRCFFIHGWLMFIAQDCFKLDPAPATRKISGATEYPQPKKMILWGQTGPSITCRDKFEIRSCSASTSGVALVPSVLLLPFSVLHLKS